MEEILDKLQKVASLLWEEIHYDMRADRNTLRETIDDITKAVHFIEQLDREHNNAVAELEELMVMTKNGCWYCANQEYCESDKAISEFCIPRWHGRSDDA